MVESINTRILTNAEFESDKGLKEKYKSYNQYIASQLRTTSIHNFDVSKLKSSSNPADELRDYFSKRLAAFNQVSEQLIERYQALKPIASNKKAEYNAYMTKINAQEGDPSLTQESKLNKLKNASSQAEYAYDAALSQALYHTHSATQYMA